MTYDLGDVVPLAVYITDDNGNPADAGGITLTVTRPDGTSETPAVTHPATGTYSCAYTPGLAGRFVVRWVATAPNASAYSDIFHVLPAEPRFLLSLDDARKQLRKPGSDVADDDQLRLYLAAVTSIVEDVVGAQASASGTIKVNGGQSSILLPERPLTVSGVTENGVALTEGTDYTVDYDAGIVYRGTQLATFGFIGGHQNVTISWTAGQGDAANVRLAARIILRHLWKADQEGGNRPAVGGTGVTNDATVATPAGFAIPRRAMELLTPNDDDRMPGFA